MKIKATGISIIRKMAMTTTSIRVVACIRRFEERHPLVWNMTLYNCHVIVRGNGRSHVHFASFSAKRMN